MKQCDQQITVIAPNLKYRLSGVTSSIIHLVPLQAKKIKIVSFGFGLPEFVPQIGWKTLFKLEKCPHPPNKYRIWHARRNVEMLLGVFLKYVLRKKYRLIFTSASQRKHTRWTKFLIRQMDHVIATSEMSKSYLKVPADVIPHGVDTQKFSPIKDKFHVKQQLGLPDGELIGCVGRIRKLKGTDIFVDAMIKLLPDHPDWYGLVLGRATLVHQIFQYKLMRKIDKAGLRKRIIFIDEVPADQVVKWYQSLSLFVAPQRWEGYGLTPLEAMACGVPVIVTKTGAFPEFLYKDMTGYLVESGDSDAIVEKISMLITNPSLMKKFSKACRKRVINKFDQSIEADKLLEIYQKNLM